MMNIGAKINAFFEYISKESYYRSLCLHLIIIIFVIIPLSLLVPKYFESAKDISSGNIRLITISEEDYKKITNTMQSKGSIDKPYQEKQNIDNSIKIIKKTSQDKVKKPIKQKTMPKKIEQPSKIVVPNNSDNIKKVYEEVSKMLEEYLQEEDDDIIEEIEKTTIFGNGDDVVKNDETQISIKDIVSIQINRCWNQYHKENSGKTHIVVTALIGYSQNGFVNMIDIENKILINQADKDMYNIMVQNVKAAIKNCSPLRGLPIKSYNEWKHIKINFKYGEKTNS